MELVRCLVLVLTIRLASATVYPSAGNYYSTAGSSTSTCTVTPCPPCPNFWQYNSGCTFNSSGTCVNCTNGLAGTYYTGNNGINPTCNTAICTQCLAGFYNPTCSSTSVGACVAAPAPPNGYYWGAPINGVSLNPQTVAFCTGTNYNPSFTTTSAGACVPCSTPAAACPYGQYYAGCGNLTAGTCQPCSNSLPGNDEWSSNGGLNPNGCGYSSCPFTCGVGQYISGCSSVPLSTSCLPCTNVVAGTTYYTVGPAYTPVCPTSACITCNNGYYLQNCGAVANPAFAGTCTSCTN